MKIKRLISFIIFLFPILVVFNCSNPKSLIKNALKDEQNKNYDSAEQKYLTIIVKYPKSDYVVEAKYRLGLIYKDVKKDYFQARMWFSQVVNHHQESEFAKFAKVGILESPDYIGAIDGNVIILGDIESGGKNMKSVFEFKKLDFDLYKCSCKLYAAETLVRKEEKFYLKTENEIREYFENPKSSQKKDLKYTIIYKDPQEVGKSWRTFKENKEVSYTIVETSLRLKFTKTEFENCIKILERYKNETGIRYLYYAPNKGCVKITTSSIKNPDKEYVVLELVE